MNRADASLYAFRSNMVVSASAGTGKTFRLVTLYSLLTLGLTSLAAPSDELLGAPVPPSRIAATTFSRAAAREIRERVERVLQAVASGRSEPSVAAYLAVFEERARITGAPPLSARALRERADEALAELPGALIDTLHGLAGRVVRGAALELGMSPTFVVLDEEAARASSDAAIEHVLTAALAQGDPSAAHLLDAAGGLAMARQRIAELLDRADEEGTALSDVGSADFSADARRCTSELADICRGLLAEQSKAFAEAAGSVLAALVHGQVHRRLPDHALEALERLFCVRARAKPLPFEDAFVSFREAIRGDNNAHRARRWLAFVQTADELGPRTVAMAALLARIAESRAAARRGVSGLGFGDLLRTARDALRDRAVVAAAARQTWDVLLVDEFQDTSRVQRDLVYLLRENAGTAAARRSGVLPTAQELKPAGLLIVGDRKQSIYGFRGADVTVFTRVAVELAGELARDALALGPGFVAPEQPNARFVSLSENRRSVADVLDFVNAFASEDFAASAPRAFDITYAPSEHLRAVAALPVAALPVAAPPVAAPPVVAVAPPEPGAHALARDRQLASPAVTMVDDGGDVPADAPAIVRGATGAMREALVAAALIAREVRASEGRLTFRDVAVLARRRSTLPLLEFALSRLDVPYLVAGRGLYDTREVRDLFAVLRMLVDPFDRDALVVVMRGPALALRDASLTALSQVGSGVALPNEWFRGEAALADALPEDERARLAAFHARLLELSRVCMGMGPAGALRHAIAELGIDQVMAALPRAAQRFANVERLIAIASARGGSVPAFVRWLDRQIADETDESEAAVLSGDDDAVTLMTIHASKGLEFKAVVAVDLGAAPRSTPLTLALRPSDGRERARLVVRHTQPEGPSHYTPEATEFTREALARDVAERKRITYVALTRARERLYLIATANPSASSAAATLRRMLAGSTMPAHVAQISAGPLLATTREPSQSPNDARPSAEVVERRDGGAGVLSISTTPLVTFDQCARRYRLLHELAQEPPFYSASSVLPKSPGLPESPGIPMAPGVPIAPGVPMASGLPGSRWAPGSRAARGAAGSATRAVSDPRHAGSAAHRVLETLPLSSWGTALTEDALVSCLALEGLAPDEIATRELARGIGAFVKSDYARAVREHAVEVRREEPFVLELGAGSGSLSLRGTIDLLVLYADGSADVIDYKSSWRDSDEVPFQLRAYALAARRRLGATRVRAGIVDLAAAAGAELVAISDAELDAFERRLLLLRGRFLQCRARDEFPGAPRATCEQLRCGFVGACHPGRSA